MADTAVEVLARRVERLERENRRLKGAGTAVVLGLVAVFLMGQAVPTRPTIEAQRFVLKDKGGKIRAALGEGSADEPLGLVLYDKNQKLRAALGLRVDDSSPTLQLVDERVPGWAELHPAGLTITGKGSASIGLSDESSPTLRLLDARLPGSAELGPGGLTVMGKGPAVTLGMYGGTQPLLRFTDRDTWTRAELSLSDVDNAAMLQFYDPRGNARARIGAASEGKASLVLLSGPRQVSSNVALEVAADGEMMLRFFRAGIIWKAP